MKLFFLQTFFTNSGHPLSHMVVGAAKIRAHQQQMAEFQQGLGAETGGGGGGGGGNKSAPQLAVPPPRAAAPVSPGSPKTAERIAASPYARLQFLGKAPAGIEERGEGGGGGGGGGGGRKGGEKKKKKKMSKQEKEKAAIRRGTGPGGLDDVVTGMNDFNDHGGGGHQMVETSQLGYVTEEDMSASASAHRDFLLQTLRNVREQLSNPSPLIIAGVEEEGNGGMMEDGSMMHGGGGGVSGGGSSYMSGGDVQSITLPLVGGEENSTAFGKKLYIVYIFLLLLIETEPDH